MSPVVNRYRIASRVDVARDHVELMLDAPPLARAAAGQFVHVRTPGTLRRPISFSRIDPIRGQVGILFQVVGSGTAWIAQQQAGDTLDVLGPLGRGFSPPEPGRAWCLVGGGVGIPPLYAALSAWHGEIEAPITAILGARTADYVVMAEDFGRILNRVEIATDDGTLGTPGTVLGPLARWRSRHPDGQVYACGPTAMLSAVADVCRGGGPVSLALEQRMGCGVGACLACVVMAHGENGPRWRRVCHDGPVFSADELVWSED